MEHVNISTKQITKRQHYVPKAYLKNFAVENQKVPQVYAVFPDVKEAKMVSIDNICCCTYLYEQIAIDPDNESHILVAPNVIEDSFIELERKYAAIISKMNKGLQETDEYELTEIEIDKLKQFMTSLMFRNPIFVHISNYAIDRVCAKDSMYINHIKTLYPDIPENVVIAMLAHDFLSTNISPNTGLLPRAMAETLKSSQLCVLRATDSPFITSGIPVKNIYGEENGIAYDLLGMPITPELYLAFVDADSRIPKVITIDDSSVKRINGRQIGNTKNLLISNKKELYSYIDITPNSEKEDDAWLFELLQKDQASTINQYNDIMNSKEIKFWS